MASSQQNIFTISKLNRLARTILESEIGTIWVSAEISNFVKASSGHWYFTLKDNKAQIRAAMFKGNNRFIKTLPKEGEQVLVRANISLYEPRGDYQLIIEQMELGGEGQLKQQFEQLKNQLAAEGLFAQQYKQPLPEVIKRVGVITSSSGAALHDILTVLKRRSPMTEVIVYPSQVQGEAATQQIIQAIETANQRQEVDVLLVGRGGGSLEDLWCFNQESLARAIFASRLPVISAVGHEVDVTIADFVADLRAATPSAAAELVSQDQQHLQQQIDQKLTRLFQNLQQQMRGKQHQLSILNHNLQRFHPSNRLKQQAQQVDHLQLSLVNLMDKILHRKSVNCQQRINQLSQCSPVHNIVLAQRQLTSVRHQLDSNMRLLFQHKKQALAESSHLLNTLSPLTTLARGYSISLSDNKVVKSHNELNSGDKLTTRFVDGEVTSTVD
ncbi:exodeoxyribonuclease VII large subunit [Neptunicella sp. SCSIO 80796]|uniref:exodeoxyribonuclease VII large subunit n=1 Tax=Neptunicella plasticusilytica TaxID=3117012 RepID=UPI003A4DCF6C